MPLRDPFEGLNLPTTQRGYNPPQQQTYGAIRHQRPAPGSYASTDPYSAGGVKYQPRTAQVPSYDPYDISGDKYAPRTMAPAYARPAFRKEPAY